eukprot:UN04024
MSDIEFVASEKSLSGDEYKNYTPNLDVGCHDDPEPLHPFKPKHPFRYLKKKYDSKDKARYAITEVRLYRSKWNKSIPASRGWEHYTENMNKGRSSRKEVIPEPECLYVCYKKQEITYHSHFVD